MPPAGAPPSLLFRQYCLLAGAAGVFALREPVAAGLALAALVFFQLTAPRDHRRAIVLATCFVLTWGWAVLREPQPPPVPAWLEQASAPTLSSTGNRLPPAPTALLGVVRSSEPLPDNRLRLVISDVRPTGDPSAPAYAGDFMVTFNTPVPPVLAGMEARLTLRVVPARGSLNPQLPDRDRRLADAGVFFIGSYGKSMPPPEFSGRPAWGEEARATLQKRFGAALAVAAGKDELLGSPLGYAPALIFNDRSLLTADQLQRLADTGIIHSLALSGMHLGYAGAAGCILLWGLVRYRPSIFLRCSRAQAVVLAGLPPVLLCIWLGQAPITLIRAFFMFLFWGLLIFMGRPKVLLDGLLAALGLMIAITPLALFDIRLQLSFAAVGSIALALPGVTTLMGRLLPRPKDASRLRLFLHSCLSGGCSLFLISSIIQIALLPLTASGFTAVPIFAPLNIFWLPVLGVWVMPLLYVTIALCAVAPAAAAPVLYVACLPLEALDALLIFLRAHDLLSVSALPRLSPIGMLGYWLFLFFLVALWRAWRNPRSRTHSPALHAVGCLASLALVVVPLSLAAPGRDEARLTVLDVGAGQAVLLEWNEGRVLLDGGPFFPGGADMGRFITGPAVAYNAWPKLNLALASHPDADHLGGLLFILEHFQVEAFGGNGQMPRPETADRLARALAHSGLRERVYRRGDVLEFPGEMRLEVLWPPEDADLKGNNASIVLRIVHRGVPLAVVCGDAERPVLEKLARMDGSKLAAPVLVLSHHGSAGGLCPDFYRAVNPQWAVASSRLDNQWGFPAKKVRDELAAQKIPLFSTGESGQIRVTRERPEAPVAIRTARASDVE